MPEVFEFASPGKEIRQVYEDASEDDNDFEECQQKIRTRKHTRVEWIPLLSTVGDFAECTAKIQCLCPGGYSKADSPYTSKKTGDITYKFKCALFKSHGCPLFFKVIKHSKTDGTVFYDLFQRGQHCHDNFFNKCTLSPEIKEIVSTELYNRLPAKAIYKKLTQSNLPCIPKYETLRKYINNNTQNIVELKDIQTYGNYMQACKDSNLLLLPPSDMYTGGTLCLFDGQVLTADNSFTTVPAFKQCSDNSLPPLPFEATTTLELMQEWKQAQWKQEFAHYANLLEKHFSALLTCNSAPYFVECLKALLSTQGWNSKTDKFYAGKLSLRGLLENFKNLVGDYSLQQKRKRWCVIYTSWGKLQTLYNSEHRSRDDTYKTNHNGFPLECGGSCILGRRYRLGYASVKSHEDALLSEMVDFCLVTAMYIRFGGLWEPPYHSADHSWAFYNANAAFPKTVSLAAEFQGLANPSRKLNSSSDITHATCWSHCSMKLNEKTGQFEDQNNVHAFKTGVRAIHRTTLEAVRKHAFSMFIEDFKERGETYICEWFEDVWWGIWSGWTLGTMPPGLPSTQNGPEGSHRWIKEEITNRKLLAMSLLHAYLLQYMKEETHYDDEHPLPTAGVVEHGIWREALLMLEKNVLQLMTRTSSLCDLYGEESVLIVPSAAYVGSMKATSATEMRKEIALSVAKFIALVQNPENPPATVTTFADYMEVYHSFSIVQLLPQPKGEYHYYSCNCSQYYENAVCSCIIAVGLFKGHFRAPLIKQLDLIGRHPQVGHPPKPASALKRQPALGNLSAKLKRQAAKRVRDEQGEDLDLEARCSQPVSRSHKCEVCKRGTYGSKMLLCDVCNKGFHMFCLVPEMEFVPEGGWVCMQCLYGSHASTSK